jgi:hypothetical protein
MRTAVRRQTQEVAGGGLTTTAQPPRATRTRAVTASSQYAPCPIRPAARPDTPGALRKGLRWSMARRPLPEEIFQRPKQGVTTT